MSCTGTAQSRHVTKAKLQLQAGRQQAGQWREGHTPLLKLLVDHHAEEVAHHVDQHAQGSNPRHAVSCAKARANCWQQWRIFVPTDEGCMEDAVNDVAEPSAADSCAAGAAAARHPVSG